MKVCRKRHEEDGRVFRYEIHLKFLKFGHAEKDKPGWLIAPKLAAIRYHVGSVNGAVGLLGPLLDR